MSTLAERIKTERKAKGLTQVSLGKAVGLTKSSINQWESGLTKKLEGQNLLNTAKALGVNPYWLATGKGVKDQGVLEVYLDNTSTAPDLKGRVLIVSWVNAGNWSEAIEDYDGETAPVSCPVSHRTFALRVNGDSMEPEFFHNDLIVVEPELEPQHGDFVIAQNGGDATFKQLWKDGGDWYLKPLNARYPIKPLGESQVIGVVREKIKQYR